MNQQSLTDKVLNLERAIREAEFPKFDGTNYYGFLTAYGIIRGVMELKALETQGYDSLMKEIESSSKSLDKLTDNIKSKSFERFPVVDHFIKSKLKNLKKYSIDMKYPPHSLKESISALLSNTDPEEYIGTIGRIGDEILNTLKQNRKPSSERISPNYMAELNTLYKIFAKYQNEKEREK